jgi:hypothetical protein
MPGGEPQLCGDKSARSSGPRLAPCQRIAATGADRAIVTTLKNEAAGILEGAAVDANLEHATVIALLKGVIVAENKTGALEERDRHGRRSESLVAESSWIINPRSVWLCISRRRWQPGIGRLPQYAIGIDCVRGSPTGRKRRRSYEVEVLGQNA